MAELEFESPVPRVSVFPSCHPISRFNIRRHPLQISKALHTKMASCLWKYFLIYWELVTKSHLNQDSVTSCASYLQSRQSLEFTQRSSGTTTRWLFSNLTLALTVNLMPALLPSDLICWVRLNSITILWARIQVTGWRVSEAFWDWVLYLIALRDGEKILSINSCWISVKYQFGCVFFVFVCLFLHNEFDQVFWNANISASLITVNLVLKGSSERNWNYSEKTILKSLLGTSNQVRAVEFRGSAYYWHSFYSVGIETGWYKVPRFVPLVTETLHILR